MTPKWALRPRNPVFVFKGRVTGQWTWVCNAPASCRAPAYAIYGKASRHWEIALCEAHEHIAEHHERQERLSHDMGTPPGGTHVAFADDDTIMMSAIHE